MSPYFRKKNQVTSKPIPALCDRFLQKLNQQQDQRVDLVLLAWPQIVGEHLAPMTKAKRLFEGVLEVTVSNSSLLSILSIQEKATLLKKLKEKFPKTDIKDIRFRIG